MRILGHKWIREYLREIASTEKGYRLLSEILIHPGILQQAREGSKSARGHVFAMYKGSRDPRDRYRAAMMVKKGMVGGSKTSNT